MFKALLYLQYHSIVNRLLWRFKRLKQPKYLIGAIFGGLYIYFYFFRYMFIGRMGAGRHPVPVSLGLEDPIFWETIGALVLFIIVLLGWVIPHKRAALTFTEAEVAFLFPAPITRRGLIHFKLVRSQAAILFSSFFLMLVSRRFAGGHGWIHLIGWWVILSTLGLHTLGSSFARSMLSEHGITNWQRRVVILLFVTALAVFVVVWTARTLPDFGLAELQNAGEVSPDEPTRYLTVFGSYFRQALTAGPLPYLLYPFRLVVRPYFAPNGSAFLIALFPALLVLLFHYYWVARSDVAFEEASVEASKKFAEKVASIRVGRISGGPQKFKVRRAPFNLRPAGMPSVAFLWKNLLSAGHEVFSLRMWIIIAMLMVWGLGMGRLYGGANVGTMMGILALGLSVWSVLLGPQIVRQDFRQDMAMADVLKAYPLKGWQVAFGELLAPAAILTAVQWCLLFIATLLLSGSNPVGINGPGVFALGLTAAMVLPMLSLILLQIPNAAILLFPGWFQGSKDGPQGIEATGQRLIALLLQVVALAVVLLPAGIVFAIVFALGQFITQAPYAVALGLLSSAVVLAAEAALGIMLLGWLFQRLDLSTENLPQA